METLVELPDGQVTPETRNITITVVEEGTQDSDNPTKVGKAHIVCEHGNDIDVETEEVTAETGARGGSATLTNVPDGTHTLTITADGYQTLTNYQIVTSRNSTAFTVAIEKE